MSSPATVIPIRPSLAVVERQVADLDDGYTRTANALMEAVMLSGLTQHQLLIVIAVWRKTYGYNKKADWIGNDQFAELTGMAATKCSTAKNELIRMGVLTQTGRQVGMNKNISEWKTKFNGISKTFTESVKQNFPKSVKSTLPNQSNTKDNIQKTERKDPPNPHEGVEELAIVCLDYYNQLSGGRCSSTAAFEKALTTVKARGVCYTVDEVNLVVRWALTCWTKRKTPPKPNNICTMTRFDGFLSDALIWADGQGSNPASCPHEEIIKLWNSKFPAKAVSLHEWNRRRPAYRDLEAVWNGKTSQGNWRELKHMGMAFELIGKSSLFTNKHGEAWLTLDWILNPKNWGSVYEQAINEHRMRKGVTA